MSREERLRMLNEQYVRASLAGDVEWYRAHLADEFVCIESDGSVLDKDAFLQNSLAVASLVIYASHRTTSRPVDDAGPMCFRIQPSGSIVTFVGFAGKAS